MRALTPHIGAYVELDGGERLGVRRAALAAGVDDVAPGALGRRDARLLYGAAQGALELLEVQPAGKRPMEAAAWLRGRAAGWYRREPLADRLATVRAVPLGKRREDQPRARLPVLRRAVAARDEPRRAATAASTACAASSCARSARNCGAHSTIARMSDTANVTCRNCGGSMLQPI